MNKPLASVDLGIAGIGKGTRIGSGGFATVFSALRGAEPVAVKILKVSADTPKSRDRFEREQETLMRLNPHDGVVPILDAGVTDRGEPYLLMPLFSTSLGALLEQSGTMDLGTTASVMVPVARAVQLVHDEGVLHRDLKPDNILLDELHQPVVADFGIARLADATGSLSEIAATPSFSAPEILNGAKPTRLSDVYGLGATAFALLNGKGPFSSDGDTYSAVYSRIMTELPPDLRTAGVPAEICTFLERTLSKKPEQRPQSAAAFADELNSLVSDELKFDGRSTLNLLGASNPLLVPVGEVEQLQRKGKKSQGRSRIPLFAALSLVLVGGLTALVWPNSATDQRTDKAVSVGAESDGLPSSASLEELLAEPLSERDGVNLTVFGGLAKSLDVVGLSGGDGGPLTVLAFSDRLFEDLTEADQDSIEESGIGAFVLEGRFSFDELVELARLDQLPETLSGAVLQAGLLDGVLEADVQASNGVMHVLDTSPADSLVAAISQPSASLVPTTTPGPSCPTGFTGPSDGLCERRVPATTSQPVYSCTEGELIGTECHVVNEPRFVPGVYIAGMPEEPAVPATADQCPANYTVGTGVDGKERCFSLVPNVVVLDSFLAAGADCRSASVLSDGTARGFCVAAAIPGTPAKPAVAAVSATCNGVVTTSPQAQCGTTQAVADTVSQATQTAQKTSCPGNMTSVPPDSCLEQVAPS